MRKLTLLLFMAVIILGTKTASAQYSSTGLFDFQCYANPDSLQGLPLLSLDEDTLGLLVIVARGWGDCFGQGNSPMPVWADSLLSPTFSRSVTRFYDDNTLGKLHFQGTVARPPVPAQDSCFYTRHIPCISVWGNCDCFDSLCLGENNEYCDSLHIRCPADCEYDSMFQDICQQVDAVYDLSQFDLTGPNGVPDGNVDFVLWYNYPHGGQGFPGFWGRSYHSDEDDTWIRYNGLTMWVGDNTYGVIGITVHELGHV